MDTGGYSWTFSSSGSVSYTVVFSYDSSKGETYYYTNVAAIYETGESSSVSVTVNQELAKQLISGTAFWDNNYNGVYDSGDSVKVDLYIMGENGWEYLNTTYTDDPGYYYFEVSGEVIYMVVVNKPASSCCATTINTTAQSYEIKAMSGESYPGNDFGFVCLTRLTNARSKGYWSWSLYNKKTNQWATRVASEDVGYINSVLGTSFNTPLEKS
ncbi:MAG: hypothetical protein QXU51_00400 [Desulfurococcus sp.]